MVKNLYAVQDVKVSVFYPPISLINDGEATRMLKDIVDNPESPISKHSDDFRLFRLGTFDDNSGVLSPLAQPEFIINASELKNKN